MICITGEGFVLPSGFVLKELTVLWFNGDFNHFIFQPPKDLQLTSSDLTTIRYASKNLNQLSYNEGLIPYSCLDEIINNFVNETIYTYSEVFERFLQNMLPATMIINVQDCGFNIPRTLPSPPCFKTHSPRYCSLAKAKSVLGFLQTYSWTDNF